MSRLAGQDQPHNDLIQAETQTLYIRNLNDKINKAALRETLYFLFGSYGHVLDVVAKKGSRMKGQAFVSFDTIASAVAAKNALQDRDLLGKKLVIVYSRTPSNKVKEFRGESLLPEKKEVRATAPGSSDAAKKSIFNDPSQLKQAQDAPAPQTNGVNGSRTAAKRPAGEAVAEEVPPAKKARQEDNSPAPAKEAVDDDEGSDMDMDESDSD